MSADEQYHLLWDNAHTCWPKANCDQFFLVSEGGLNSGLMMAQTTAAALVSECKTMSFPASVDTIPTNCDQEDHVSMGPIAGWKAIHVCGNVRDVLAIEILAAFQAIHLRGRQCLPPRLDAVFSILSDHIPRIDGDRVFSIDIQTISRLIESRDLMSDAETLHSSQCCRVAK